MSRRSENEKPKSTARVKYCSAPSKRCIAASSSVRNTPERFEDLRPDLVLAAIAPGGGGERRSKPSPRFSITSKPLFSSSG